MKVKLDDLLEEVCDKTRYNNQYPILTASKNGIFTQTEYFKKQVASKNTVGYKIIKKGEFTYRAMSDTGKFYPNMLETEDIGIVSPAYPVFKISKSDLMLPDYLKYYFKSNAFQRSISSFIQGSTRASIKFSKIKTIEIELPDMYIQAKIIHKLKQIQLLIDINNRILDNLDNLIKARFVEMFSGKYPIIILGDKFQTMSGGTPSKKHPEYYERGTIPWLTSGEINQGIIKKVKNMITEEGVRNSSAKLIPKNSILIAMYGATAGQVGLLKTPTTTNQAVCAILPNGSYLPEYLYYAISMNKSWVIQQCVGGAQPNISQTIIRRMRITDAPLRAQKTFAGFVHQVDKSKFG